MQEQIAVARAANIGNIDTIITNISSNYNMIPVIGYDCLVMKGTGENYLVYIAKKLAEKYGININGQPKGLDLFNWVYSAAKALDPRVKYTLPFVAADADKGVDTETLNKLVSIYPFKYFINATFSQVPVTALEQHRAYPKGDIRKSSYVYAKPGQLVPNDMESDKSPLRIRPIVYNIFGTHAEDKIKIVASDDELLSFNYDMIKRFEQDESLQNLRLVMRDCSLLFLGCSYPDWLFRFMVNTFIQNNQTELDKVLVDNAKDPSIGFYLERMKFVNFAAESTKIFIEDLYSRAALNNLVLTIDSPDFIFISYKREDEVLAMNVIDQLLCEGIPVWIDFNDIRLGNEINDEVKKGMEKCKIFMPIISNNSIAATTNEYVRQEWNYYKVTPAVSARDKVIPIIQSGVVLGGPLAVSFNDLFGTPNPRGIYLNDKGRIDVANVDNLKNIINNC